MSQQINNDNVENKAANLEARNSASTSKNNSKETEPQPVLEAKVLEEKSFSERWKTNRFWIVRATYHVFYSVWIVVMAIGGLIAWLIALLFI